MLGIIKRNFIYLTPHSFVLGLLYKALVRSHLEHAVSVWSPHHKLLIEKLEKVKTATKLVIAVKTHKYDERLKYLNLYRRLRGDMLDAYKILN